MSMHKPGPAGAAETLRRQLNTASALTPEGMAAGPGSASASASATALGRGAVGAAVVAAASRRRVGPPAPALELILPFLELVQVLQPRRRNFPPSLVEWWGVRSRSRIQDVPLECREGGLP